MQMHYTIPMYGAFWKHNIPIKSLTTVYICNGMYASVNKPTLAHYMACKLFGANPVYEPMFPSYFALFWLHCADGEYHYGLGI